MTFSVLLQECFRNSQLKISCIKKSVRRWLSSCSHCWLIKPRNYLAVLNMFLIGKWRSFISNDHISTQSTLRQYRNKHTENFNKIPSFSNRDIGWHQYPDNIRAFIFADHGRNSDINICPISCKYTVSRNGKGTESWSRSL